MLNEHSFSLHFCHLKMTFIHQNMPCNSSSTSWYRRYVTVCCILLLCGAFIFYETTIYYNNLNEEKIRQSWSLSEDELSRDEENVCDIPERDPFDPLIMKYVSHPPPLVCNKVQPFMTLIDDHGYLRYNETEVKIMKGMNVTFICIYQTFDRKIGSNDNAVEYDKEITLTNPVQLTKDMVIITCYNSSYTNGTAFYWNIHAHPAITEDRLFADPSDDQLSLLFFLIDSTSHSALQRNLPLTYNYTKNVMGMKYFTKLNKIGSNSYPNQMAFLTGKRVRDEQSDMLTELLEGNLKKPFNTWPFIWKQFIAKSYATAVNEDWPKYGIFNYYAKGFTKKMVDYYYHVFWILAQKRPFPNTSAHCFSNLPYAKLSMDLTRRHMVTFKNKLQFVFSSITDSSHSKDNQVEQIELYVMEFWKFLYEGNYLNNTVIIFISDHGLRVGKIRKTLPGLLEERLPFYGIWFPRWFYAKHPNIEKNIEQNLDRLTTPFDVYETMKDIADGNYDGKQRNPNSRGQSQLYPLPLNRTCKMAGIANQWCTCIREIPMIVNHTVAVESANFVINQLNILLDNFSDICQNINLSHVEYLKQLINNQKLKEDAKSVIETYVIGLETNPFNATFEATVKLDPTGIVKIWSLDGEIARTSGYAGLSDCIEDKFLRQYCPCFNVTHL